MPDTPDHPGPVSPLQPPEGVLASARTRAVELLTRGFADDRLSESELESMLDRAYAARTMEELNVVVSALAPEEPSAPGSSSGTAMAVRGGAAGALAQRRRISAFLSGQSLRLTGALPTELQVRSRLGHVELDLTGATFQPGVTEIDVRAVMGYVEIDLPPTVRVESEARAILGYFAMRGEGEGGSDSIVRITGRAVMGYAECFVARRRPDESSR